MPKGAVLFVWLLTVFVAADGIKEFYHRKLFPDDICSTMCGQRVHTMCKKQKFPNTTYKRISATLVATYHRMNIRKILLHGHNGLRNRIAHNLHVSNMVELNWDRSLQKMARNYLRFGPPAGPDECTSTFPTNMTYKQFVKFFASGVSDHRFVAQNLYCLHAKYMPTNFAQRAISQWYHDNEDMDDPIYQRNMLTYRLFGVLRGHNNFTHMIFPYVYRIGCSIASYNNDEHFCIACNYYPFYHTEDDKVIFEFGVPAASCPMFFPLRSLTFKGICMGHVDESNLQA